MALITITLGILNGDQSTGAEALRLAFVSAARSAGLNRAQTIAAWATFQSKPAPATIDDMWDTVMAVLPTAPPVTS